MEAPGDLVIPEPAFEPVGAIVDVTLVDSVVDAGDQKHLPLGPNEILRNRVGRHGQSQRIRQGRDFEPAQFPLEAEVGPVSGTGSENDERDYACVGAGLRVRPNQLLIDLPFSLRGLVGPMQRHGGVRDKINSCSRDVQTTEGDISLRVVLDAHLVLDRSLSRQRTPNRRQFQRRIRAGETQRHLVPVGLDLSRFTELPVQFLALEVGQSHRRWSGSPIPVLSRVAQTDEAERIARHRQD